jgi:hypothetical protein
MYTFNWRPLALLIAVINYLNKELLTCINYWLLTGYWSHLTLNTVYNASNTTCSYSVRAPGSSVGIATDYGLDGAGIESRWGRDFSHTSRPAPGPPSLLYKGYRIFPGGKAAGAWYWTPTPFYRRGWEWVELYHYSPSRPMVACYRVTFTLPIVCILCTYTLSHLYLG